MRVLIGTDGSECSFNAVREFIRFARPGKYRVTILYVMPFMTVGIDTAYLQVEMERDGLTAMYAVRSMLTGIASEIETELREGNSGETIVEIARDREIDLIVIGHRGAGGTGESLLGSAAGFVVRNAHCSVLVAK